MKTQIERTKHAPYSRMMPLGEIFLVFLPAFILVGATSSWVGENVTRGFIVVWCTYAIMLTIIWVGMKVRNRSWRSLGLTFSRVTFKEGFKIFGLSVLVFIAGATAFLIAPVVVSLLTDVAPAADFSKYDYLKDNLVGLLVSLVGVYIISSFGEEVIFRAFLIDRIMELIGSSRYSHVIAVILSSVLFGLVHYEWGLMGVLQAGFMGLAMGSSYVLLKRRVWIIVLAHMYMDTLLFVQIYVASN
jgi:membrane protease YdiL (CAAX protease family)